MMSVNVNPSDFEAIKSVKFRPFTAHSFPSLTLRQIANDFKSLSTMPILENSSNDLSRLLIALQQATQTQKPDTYD